MIQFIVYDFPSRVRYFFYSLIGIILAVVFIGVSTKPSIDFSNIILIVGITVAGAFLGVTYIQIKIKRHREYVKIMEKLKADLEEFENGLRFNRRFDVVQGSLEIYFLPRATPYRRLSSKGVIFKRVGDPEQRDELLFKPSFPLRFISKFLDIYFNADAWKILDPDYRDHDIFIILVPSVKFIDYVEKVNLIDDNHMIDLLFKFTDNKLIIEAQGSSSDEVEITLSCDEMKFYEEFSMKGGESKEISLLPRLNEPLILVIHGKSVGSYDVNISRFKRDMVNLFGGDISKEFAIWGTKLKILIKFRKKRIEKEFEPEVIQIS